ncbi:MAG: glycine betaine ABC transporter substrate-binding protein [Thermodesulfobacteriota bacterium]|nr:glycine betaine ABC transporter substrate-binding protein [Thermodesulfobacteriota bacterium]
MKKRWSNKLIFATVALILMLCTSVSANDKIRFASVSWTGVTVKTELAVNILDSLGYKTTKRTLSVPIAYKALEMGDADIFLGNWMPSMATIANKFFDNGSVVKYVANMPGAKYTLAAPSYVVEAGLKDFSDIARYGDKLEHKIYGIEAGNDGNQIILDMIEKDKFGLGDFKLVETSEAIMVAEVKTLAQQGKWVVFLGWAPHHMNTLIDMQYLTGSTAKTFGSNNGTATVYTNLRRGFAEEQPNVAKLLKNLIFPVPMMNEISRLLNANSGMKHAEAGLRWIKQHPEVYKPWFENVTTVDGKPALLVFEGYLQQQ